MTVSCFCGTTIHDKATGQPGANSNWAPFWAELGTALSRPRAPEAITIELRRKVRARWVGECPGCGRLWVSEPEGGFVSYAPEQHRSHGLIGL
jgi:hypothetical protein